MKELSRHQWRIAAIASVIIWGLTSLLFTFGPQLFDLQPDIASQVAGVSPVHCLILGLMPLVLILPLTVKTFTKQRLFPLYCGVWSGLTIPALMLFFRWSANLTDRCDRVFIGCGIFAFVVISGEWIWHTIRVAIQSRGKKANNGSSRIV